jgi:NAD(P)-dependent dehydrogenase (short-subunit alcohol dehydrogenase family)
MVARIATGEVEDTKAGVNGLTRQVAMEDTAENIRANVVTPGRHLDTRLGDFRRQQSPSNCRSV